MESSVEEAYTSAQPRLEGQGRNTGVPADNGHCKATCGWQREAVPGQAHRLGFPLAQPHLWTQSQAEPELPACSTLSSPEALLSFQLKRLCAALCSSGCSAIGFLWIRDPGVSLLDVPAPKDSADPTAFQYLIHNLHKSRWAFLLSR